MVIASLTKLEGYVEVALTNPQMVYIDNEVSYMPSVIYKLPLDMDTREKVRKVLKSYPKLVLGYSLSHEPIIKEQHQIALSQGTLTWHEIIRKQRLMQGDYPYIDEFGFYVYAYAELDFEGITCKDTRYELNETTCTTEYMYSEMSLKIPDMKEAIGIDLQPGVNL